MLSDSQRQSFDDDGYLVIPRVFHVDELAWLGEEARSVVHGHAAKSASTWSSDEAPAGSFIDVHLRQEAFRRLAVHPRLRALTSGLTRTPVRLLRTRLVPGARTGDPIWRRDAEIWRRTRLHEHSNASGWITGLRADQSDHRRIMDLVAADTQRGLLKLNPLLDLTRAEVDIVVRKAAIPINPLHAQGFLSIGCATCTRAVTTGEPERAGRWWWENEEKKECGLHLN